MARPPPSIAQRSAQKLRFDHKDMDFYFAWSMSRAIYGGSDQQECFDLIAVDLPGQGATPDLGLVFEACMGPAMVARWAAPRTSRSAPQISNTIPARNSSRVIKPIGFLLSPHRQGCFVGHKKRQPQEM
jgi:hypothetical protein